MNTQTAPANSTVTLSVVPALPETSSNITTKTGKVSGVKFTFGELSAKDLKVKLQTADPMLKGKKLAAKVNAALRDESAQRNILAAASLQALIGDGYVPDSITKRTGRATIELVQAGEPEDKSAALVAENEALKARIAALEAGQPKVVAAA